MSTKLTVDTNALLSNQRIIMELAKKRGVSVSLVTKGLVGHKALVKLLVNNGAVSICEASVQNLAKWDGLPAEKWLIRSPLPSETDKVVRYADVSLVSEQLVLEKLSASAAAQGKTHKAVIMLELGELREGCMPDELIPLCETCLSLPGLELYGVGTHLSSFNEIVPDEANMAALIRSAKEAENTLGVKLPLISGGSSSSVMMLEKGTLPPGITHLRIGEAILLGNIVCYDVPFEGARTDAFSLEAEIIEVKEKPELPWGERAGSAEISGPPHSPPLRKRALIAVGKQDVCSKYLAPEDPAIEIIGDTSDCMIADVTNSEKKYKPGDTLGFRVSYNGLVSAMASDYVEKILI